VFNKRVRGISQIVAAVEKQYADKGSLEVALETQWQAICNALEEFLRGETSDAVFVDEQLHPVTVQRLRDTYQLEVWEGLPQFGAQRHFIRRKRAKPCENGHINECRFKCACPNK
jgi:hypothetical protein